MDAFLLWIGAYNALAPLVFVPMVCSDRFADLVLRRATEIIAEPYAHGPYERLFLWWVATTNGALGLLMILARRWDPSAQREVAIVVVGVYACMWLVMLIGARGPKWGRGIWVTHALWLAQLAWGIHAIATHP